VPKPVKSGHEAVNGVNYYYAVYGKGEPLLLLHGGLGQIEMFGPEPRHAGEDREVIGVDLHGHGRTDLGNRDISLVDMGADLGVLREEAGLPAGRRARLLAAAAASRSSSRSRIPRWFAAGAGVRHLSARRFLSEMLPQQAAVSSKMMDMMKETPMYQSYVAIAPHPEEFPKLLDKMGEYMRKSYDWSADVKKLTMPTLLIYGDSDMIRPEHIVKFYQLLGGGQKDAGWQREHMSGNRLAILPNVTHYEMGVAPQMVETALPFLNGYARAGTWAEQVSGTK
jgi:pimeloyl-ACP methyl ester carboxylesterase